MGQGMDAETGLGLARGLLKAGSPEAIAEGMAALQGAVRDGDAEASCLMAVLLGMGVGAPRNLDLALDTLRAAARGGSRSARDQLAVLAPGDSQVRVEDWTAPCEKRVLSASPRVVAIDGFLSRPVCDWIIARAAPRLEPAKVYGADATAQSGGRGRSNTAFEFDFLDFDMVLLMVRARIAATIGVPAGALEPPQVLHYEVGERFARHHDYLDPGLAAHAADIAQRGQRAVTFLIYLNADFDGGETDFPLLGLRHKGAPGDALYFGNLDAAGEGDPRTVHEGLAPLSGEKWLLSQWIRNRARV